MLPPLIASCLIASSPVSAQPQPEDITVVGASPLAGPAFSRDRVPGDTQSLLGADIARDGPADLLDALDMQVAGVNLDSASGNPFQPNLSYDGFLASPLQGAAQGIAVYLNGIRFNQAFGDTVNWDLLPDLAIDRVDIGGPSPVYGLNALGGSINARLKNGFSYQGAEADLSGGSFGQRQGEFQYGRQDGQNALYVAASALRQGGWRDGQSSDIQNLFADAGTKRRGIELHLNLILANSVLNGPGPSPVQLLAADPAAQFTAPNRIANRFLQLAASADAPLADRVSMQATAYYSYLRQRVANGNAPNDAPCGDGSGLLCSDPGIPSTTRGGGTIPDFLAGGPYSVLDLQTTNTNAYGATVQFDDNAGVAGSSNHLVAGGSFDGARSLFSATDLIGGLDAERDFVGPGVTLDEAGNAEPVRVAVDDAYFGLFGSDRLDVTRRFAVTVSGRLNAAEIDLHDRGGGGLSGNHAYVRLDPALGASYSFAPALTLHAGYTEANRAPTPLELSCAGPTDSCTLANFFVGDPDLKQVVAHTLEAGLRGRLAPSASLRLGYDLDLFRTVSDDDIGFVNSVRLGRAYFANIGRTRRQGAKLRLQASTPLWSAYIGWSYTEATFESGFTESAGSDPQADAQGSLIVRPGDSLPGIPRTTLKFGADIAITKAWKAGFDGVLQGGQILFGDEAGLNPKLPGYVSVNIHVSCQITPRLQMFGSVRNVNDARYYSYGTFSPTASVFLAQAPGAANPRSYSPAAPIGGFGGIRFSF